MVAAGKMRGLTLNVRNNMIALQLVRDAFDSEAFEAYKEISARLWDALSAIDGCRFNKHRTGGVELASWGGGRCVGRAELYCTTFEVFTEAEVYAAHPALREIEQRA
jgi:hypothetical protein